MYSKIKSYFIGDLLLETERLHDRSRIDVLFNIASSVLLLGLSATIISLIIGAYPVLIPGLGNFLFASMTLFLLKKKKLQFTAHLYFFVLFCLLFGNLNFNYGTMHVGSPFWVMLLNILVMYILGLRWGIFYLFLSLLGFLYYLHFVFPVTLQIVNNLPPATYFSAYYETIFALFLLGYVISTILKASRQSDELLIKQNRELIAQNDIIKASDEEKTVLLKEIHHRVKNNLQVIISLLRLQMRELTQEEALSKFKDSINRVLTMALIHEKIYQSEELSKVNLVKYFESLSGDLKNSYQTGKPVKVYFHFEMDRIGLKSIVPMALIYNELFSNSLKHAFHEIQQPEIEVSLYKVNNLEFEFHYSDNGIWKQSVNATTFGSELIESLTEQLEGQLAFQTQPTKYIFRFKNLDI